MEYTSRYLKIRTAVRAVTYTALVGIPMFGVTYLDMMWVV